MIKKYSVYIVLGFVLGMIIPAKAQKTKAQEATWIWYPGDYEIWLSNKMQARRTERGAFFPPLWRYYSPYALVTFTKEFNLPADDVLHVAAEGQTKIQIDGKMFYGEADSIPVAKGNHNITIKVYNQEGVPALFVKSLYLVSTDSWKVTFEDKEWIDESGLASGISGTKWEKVGSWNFNSASELPSQFQLETKPQYVASKKEYLSGFIADFGKETFGYVKLHGVKGSGKITLYYGESEEEAKSVEFCETLDRIKVTKNTTPEFRIESSKAFRYVNVQLEGKVSLDSVSMDYEYLPLEYKGQFNCSDDLINQIWDVSAYTMHLTTREFFIDGIKRDRWVWSGDAYQSYLMNYYLFNDNESVKRTLYALRGKEPVSTHINTIMDYSLYWFLGVYDYYKFSGDKEFIQQIYPRMQTLMEFCLNRRNANGMMEGLTGDWVFIDWADGLTKQGEVSFEQLLLARSLETMALCAELSGDTDNIGYYQTEAAQLKEKLNTQFWSEEKKAFLHNRVDGKVIDKVTRYTNMFAIFFDYLNTAQKDQVKHSVLLNDEVQKITTPYMRFYELEALCALGEQDYVLQEMKSYWGDMLELGATSFWEKYDPNESGTEHLAMYGRPYGKSLCHAWGASPIYLLGKYYLGVEPTAPGYETYTVVPNLGGLKWMEGKVPTPNGAIEVYCTTKEIKVTASEGTGTLIIQSKRKPKTNQGTFVKKGATEYHLTIEPEINYRISYKAVD